ncbi:DMT family transporter [bacterium]|nr:DMT family transporter [bacterium]
MRNKTLIGYFFIIGTAFFTAFSYIFGKKVSDNLFPETVAFYWFLGALIVAVLKRIVFTGLGYKFSVSINELGKYKKIMILTSLITVFGAASWVIALRIIGPPSTSFLMKFQVLFAVIFGVIFLGERLGKMEIIGIVFTIIGGLFITFNSTPIELIGSFYAISAAFFYSILFILVKKMAADLNMIMVATLRSMGVVIIGFLYLIISGKFQLPNSDDFFMMLLGGTCGAYIGKAFQFQAIKLVDVSRTTAITPLEAVFVIFLSFIFFDTVPDLYKLIGGFLIILGVIFLLIFRKNNLD